MWSLQMLLAAEAYPSPIRATAHGVSAAIGKLDALTAVVLYNYIGSNTKFLGCVMVCADWIY